MLTKQLSVFFMVCCFMLAAWVQATPALSEEKEKSLRERFDPTSRKMSKEGSKNYIHRWIKFPEVTAEKLLSKDTESIKPREGRAIVVFFLASWCEPCQLIVEDFMRIEKRYNRLFTDFVFVFAHDTRADAEGFSKEFRIKNGVLANHEILKTFNNPELPAIYVGDRRGWLATRYLKTSTGDMAELEKFLRYVTAF